MERITGLKLRKNDYFCQEQVRYDFFELLQILKIYQYDFVCLIKKTLALVAVQGESFVLFFTFNTNDLLEPVIMHGILLISLQN